MLGSYKYASAARLVTYSRHFAFTACVWIELLYGLSTAWLSQAERRKLDAFQARCLRRTAKVQHSYYSRISNQTVLEMCDAKPLSATLLEQQLLYYGDIARKPADNVLR